MIKKNLIYLIVIILLSTTLVSKGFTNHDINVKLVPNKSFLEVTDTITLPEIGSKSIHFLLHGNLKIFKHSDNVEIRKVKGKIDSMFFGINSAEFKISDRIPINHYLLTFKNKTRLFILQYRGEIDHPLKMSGAEYSRGFSETPGIISEKGVYLSGSTFWVPWLGKDLKTFKMKVKTPTGWVSVSQGKELNIKGFSGWDSPEPMDEIYLIAGKFFVSEKKSNKVKIVSYLRKRDENLSEKYLNTTIQYLKMYEKLIGKYPYSKFALIENFWETGYGMPSFTLLGPKIIRFPFILHSSYPHELLHNWWGNSVFVDYERGNWCEGLTAYLADHLVKEQRGQGDEYRRDTLKAFKDYVNDSNEFPVSKFKARYNSASSSIGYGKVLMIFNMLREKFGDKIFVNAIKKLYEDFKFQKTTFENIRQIFETVSGENLKRFFKQWVYSKGYPALELKKVENKKVDKGYELKFVISQSGTKFPFILDIPVQIYLENDKMIKVKKVVLQKKQDEFSMFFNSKPLRLEIDPDYDLFRKLSDREIPATFSSIFGSKKILMILPEDKTGNGNKKYERLANIWSKNRKGEIEIVSDNKIRKIPVDRSVWIFGWNNRFRNVIEKGIKEYNGFIKDNFLIQGNKKTDHKKNSIVLTIKNPSNPKITIAFLSTDREKAIPGLSRKLPHYGKYSYLTFSGDEPAVNMKGQWEITDSPLVWVEKKRELRGYKKPKRRALAYLEPLFSEKKMKKHIEFLSSKKLKGRGLGTKELDIAAEYIKKKFSEYGIKPISPDGRYIMEWTAKIPGFSKPLILKNLAGLIPGTKLEFRDQAVVLSAHYDHLGLGMVNARKGNKGKVHPGADDNASGVAVMLEIARTLGKKFKPDRTILFVAFTGEENGLIGSKFFLKNRNMLPFKAITADVNLDTVGRLEGKKPMIIGGASAKEWKFIFMGIGFTTGIETDMITQDLDASDQISFSREGIPGIQIFSGPNTDYHKPTDTPDKIDYKGLVKIASVTKEVIVYLSERKKPLNFTGKKAGKKSEKSDSKKTSADSRPSIGIMPDFTFKGKGVRVGMVITNTVIGEPLKKGDVITAFNGVPVKDLKSYTVQLYKYKPGDIVKISVDRKGKILKIKIKLKER